MGKIILNEKLTDLELFIEILEQSKIDYSGIAYDEESFSVVIENVTDEELQKSYDKYLKELPKQLLKEKTSLVKKECKKRIEAKYPDWMQRAISLAVCETNKLTEIQQKYKKSYPEYVKYSEGIINASNKLEEKLKKLSNQELQQINIAEDKHWS